MLIESVRRAAQQSPTSIATVDGDRQRTWEEVASRIARLAGGLRSLGVEPGDRVGVLGLNSDAYYEALYAVWWLRALVVPMNTRWAVDEHIYSIADSGLRTLLVDDAQSAVADDVTARLGDALTIVRLEGSPARSGVLTAAGLREQAEAVDPADRSGENRVGIFYTGGTTGHPKGVVHTESSLWTGAAHLALDERIPERPRYLHVAPMFHLGDLEQGIAVTGMAGTHVFMSSFTPERFADVVRSHDVNMTALVPTMIGMTLDAPGFDRSAFDGIELLKYGGSPISDTLLARTRAAFPRARLIQNFGQTETAGCGTSLHDLRVEPDDPEGRRHSVGQAHYGCEVGVFDEEGRPQARGAAGEVWIRTSSAMACYWNQPELTAQTLSKGWVRTGDVGFLDSAGYLQLRDRAKDMVISGGENVYSIEVENAIASHPAVSQVAVIGVPDERWGERVHAVVVCRPGERLGLEELQSHCRGLIAGYKIPRSYEVRATPLPLSAVGKVLKTVLRSPYWQGTDREIN
ncbi:putative fatty-acid--CoA ligase [Nocardia nova SH22a]|uniref:Putative fatty-acid--CoA ligase n=1 Tax=Nocardia nova SH22a TaxID=1415166 RepID=W5TKX9_9NOCA|nr:AMP-binding protein [Nocardia nova]AHH19824.1 putative fatty-acid--CoA ligase [Nocardia nova SH22a]